MWKSKPIILIAEDDPNDADLLKRTVAKTGIALPIQIVRDGEEAINYLEGNGKFADRDAYPFPTVIITDIKMPRMNGFDVLQWLKHHLECSNHSRHRLEFFNAGKRRLKSLSTRRQLLFEETDRSQCLGANHRITF